MSIRTLSEVGGEGDLEAVGTEQLAVDSEQCHVSLMLIDRGR